MNLTVVTSYFCLYYGECTGVFGLLKWALNFVSISGGARGTCGSPFDFLMFCSVAWAWHFGVFGGSVVFGPVWPFSCFFLVPTDGPFGVAEAWHLGQVQATSGQAPKGKGNGCVHLYPRCPGGWDDSRPVERGVFSACISGFVELLLLFGVFLSSTSLLSPLSM